MAEVKEEVKVETKEEKKEEKKEEIDYVSIIKTLKEENEKLSGDVKGLLEILKGNTSGGTVNNTAEEKEEEEYTLEDLIADTKENRKRK